MQTSLARPQRVSLLGASVDLVTPDEVMAFTARRVAEGRRALVANHNLHSLYLVRREPGMQAAYAQADLIELDSTPLVLWGRLTRKPVSRRHRCTYLDWRDRFWTLAERHGWRVFHLGGKPGVGDEARTRLRARYPGVILAGRHGFFDAAPGSADNTEILAEIAAFRPDILFVGMGMPRQELWIAHHYDQLASAVVFPLGAAFDYEAGAQAAAPRWIGRLGLEWAFRLAISPGRLAARYLVEPWSLVPAAAADLVRAYAPSQNKQTEPDPLPV